MLETTVGATTLDDRILEHLRQIVGDHDELPDGPVRKALTLYVHSGLQASLLLKRERLGVQYG